MCALVSALFKATNSVNMICHTENISTEYYYSLYIYLKYAKSSN